MFLNIFASNNFVRAEENRSFRVFLIKEAVSSSGVCNHSLLRILLILYIKNIALVGSSNSLFWLLYDSIRLVKKMCEIVHYFFSCAVITDFF